jgi:uncharacterized cupin superfamily protein
MPETVLALADLVLEPRPAEYQPAQPTRRPFDASRARLTERMGLTTLGCTVTAVKPGASAYPFHSHRANDELFYVLAGNGELRLGEQRLPVKAGDVIACPKGGPETAHQLVNTGDAELRYLAIASSIDPEICEYPDSGKVGAYAGGGPSGLYHMSFARELRDYWDGE